LSKAGIGWRLACQEISGGPAGNSAAQQRLTAVLMLEAQWKKAAAKALPTAA